MIMNNKDNTEQCYNERTTGTMSYYGTLSPASSVDPTELLSPIKTSLSPPHLYNTTNLMPMDHGMNMVEFMPYLEIKEQPVEKFRFRYKSEMVGTHGSLTGVNSDKIRKNTYPTVQLHNYEGTGVIRCSLVQIKSDEPHAHRLVIKAGNGEKDDPHNIEVSPERGYVAVFQGMGIIHTAKKYLKSELSKKKTILLCEEMSRKHFVEKLTKIQEADIDRQAEALSKTINLNTVRLKFEAFEVKHNTLYPICQPQYSHGINNLKSALTGELKIVRMDHTTTSCVGGQEIYLLVEKVTKNNIKVRFFECDEEDNEIWSDYGRFSHIDVHHQYAIVLKVPPYRDLNIENTVEVCIQLERPSDGARSEPRVFKYKPSEKIGRKRTRYSESLSSGELPVTINNLSLSTSYSIPDSLTPQDPLFFDEINNIYSDEFRRLFGFYGPDYQAFVSDSVSNPSESVKMLDLECSTLAKKIVSALEGRLKSNPSPEEIEGLVDKLFNTVLTKCGNNALHTSILCEQYQHLQYILVLLSKMTHLNIADIQNNSNETALHLAIKVNKPAIVNLLLSVGANPNIIDDKGNIPLHLAVCDDLNLDEYVKLVQDSEINKDNYNGFTPLHLAVMKNNLKSVQILVDAKAHVNAKYTSNGNTVLHMAVEEKYLDIVKFLVQKTDVCLDAENYSKTTPIHMAKLLANEDDISEQIWQIINHCMKDKGFEIGSIKSEPDEEDSSSDSDEITIKSEPASPDCMETEDDLLSLRNAEFTDACISFLGKILDGSEILQKLAKDLDFYSIATSIMTISTQRLLNYANVTGISVFNVRKLLVSYGAQEAVNAIDNLYFSSKEDGYNKPTKNSAKKSH